MTASSSLPLFPLGVVLFPGMSLPLHIFEERYKQMIGECLEQESEFGVVYYTGEDFYRVGCAASITRLVKRYEDGRMNIVVQGRSRFTIRRILSDKPFLVGQVEYFDDDPTGLTEETEALSRSAAELFKDVLRQTAPETEQDLTGDLSTRDLSFLIPASAGFTLKEKQAFLEMTSVTERLKKSTSSLKQLLDRLRTTKEIERLISGNGHLKGRTI